MSAGSVLTGVVHGRTIELDRDPALPTGQAVEVVLRAVESAPVEPFDFLDLVGGWDDDPEGLDEYLEWNRQQRKLSRPEIP